MVLACPDGCLFYFFNMRLIFFTMYGSHSYYDSINPEHPNLSCPVGHAALFMLPGDVSYSLCCRTGLNPTGPLTSLCNLVSRNSLKHSPLVYWSLVSGPEDHTTASLSFPEKYKNTKVLRMFNWNHTFVFRFNCDVWCDSTYKCVCLRAFHQEKETSMCIWL